MCGIAGILSFAAGRPPQREELAAMIGRIAHRGPDGRGELVDGPAASRTRASRSSTSPGAGSRSTTRTERVWVVLQRRDLQLHRAAPRPRNPGHRFCTQSDTEVIVHLYEEHGDDFVDHLNGQFAIALWDARRRRLVLARDRAGIRPLFYTEAAGRIVFASEIKALFALPEVRRLSIRWRSPRSAPTGAPLPPRTAFEGVSPLPPGHMLVVGGRSASPAVATGTGTFPTADRRAAPRGSRLRRGTARAADRRGAPAAARGRPGRRVPQRRTRFVDRHGDHPRLHRDAAPHLLAHVRGRRVRRERAPAGDGRPSSAPSTRRSARTRSDIAAAFPRTIWHTETPIVRTAPTPLMLLSGHVRASGYKVVLTGEGADEVFGGYDLFKEAKIRRFWRGRRTQAPARILERLYPYLRNSPAAAARSPRRSSARAWTRSTSPGSRTSRAGPRRAASGSSSPPSCAKPLAAWNPLAAHRAPTLPRRHRPLDPDGARPVRRGAHADERLPALLRRATAWRWPTPSRAASRSSTTA